jgi:hypothetical protein
MATKTVVCPVCGSASAPGRFACSECGALLVAVAMSPRGRVSDALGRGDAEATEMVPARVTGATEARLRPRRRTSGKVAAIDPAPAEEPVAALEPPPVREPAPMQQLSGARAATAADPVAAARPVATVDAHRESFDDASAPFDENAPFDASAPFDENAPLAAAVRRPTQPAVLHDLPDRSGSPIRPDSRAPSVSPAPTVTPAPIPRDPGPPSAPSWPPPGDRGPLAAPKPRIPAGAYLPPSAVLPPLDLPGAASMAVAGAGSAVAGAAVATPALEDAPDSASGANAWLGRASTALADALGSIRVAADGSRRAVFAGAGLASLGILLPWINTLPGASPLANYAERWGLAGPGMWLVFLGLLALAAVAAATGRPASWPVGLPAIVAAAFLAGVIWPYIVGGYGRSIGIWVVVAGALVLLVGGLLDRRAHHDRGDASV